MDWTGSSETGVDGSSHQRGGSNPPAPPPLAGLGLTATIRSAEPAWHRRQRKKRGEARTLLRIAAAADLLNRHHSAQMPFPQNGSGGERKESIISTMRDGKWDCNICGTAGNWATRYKCRACTAYGPKGAGGYGKGGGGKNGNSGGKGGGYRYGGLLAGSPGGLRPGGGVGGGATTFAQAQLQKQHEDLRLQKQKEEFKKREETLKTANQKLQRELAAAKAQGSKGRDDDDEMDDEDEQDSEEKRQERIEAAQKALPYLALHFGEESDQVRKAKSEIDGLQRASREAKPYKTHRGQLERRLERLQRQQARAREEEDEILVEVERAQERLNKVRAAIAEREKSMAAVDDELKELLRKAISEGESGDQGPLQAAGDPNKAWDTINSTLAEMVSQPGVPQGWAEQLGLLLEQVRLATIAIRQHSGGPPAAAVGAPPAASAAETGTAPPRGAGTSASTSSASTSAAASTSTSTSPTPPAPPAQTPVPPAQATAASVATSAAGGPPPQADPSATSWASRVHDLAYAEEGGAMPAQPNADQAAAAATAVGAESESEDDEDDMASVVGTELERQDEESVSQHKLRVARMLRERAKKKKEDKQRERRTDKKKSDGKEGKDKVNQKKK